METHEPKTRQQREELGLKIHLDPGHDKTGIQPKDKLDIAINWGWALTFATLAILLTYLFLK